MSTSIFLNIIPIVKATPSYDQNQLALAVETEYYQIRDQVNIALSELPGDIITETTIFTMPTSADSYDFFPPSCPGLNTPPVSGSIASLSAVFSSYNLANSITHGLPDGFGARYGLYQWPIFDSVVAAGTGQPHLTLQNFITFCASGNFLQNGIIPGTPQFDIAWKEVADITSFGISQTNYLIKQVNTIMDLVTSTVSSFFSWNRSLATSAVMAAVVSAVNNMNLSPLKSIGFFNNAFRDILDVTSLTDITFVNMIYTELLFGMDKYITPFAAKNIIPMDYGDLRINVAKGIIREMGVANEICGGGVFKSLTQEELIAMVYSTYSIDRHILNRIIGINAGEEPLPSNRLIIKAI